MLGDGDVDESSTIVLEEPTDRSPRTVWSQVRHAHTHWRSRC
jgi:hypothetical protein